VAQDYVRAMIDFIERGYGWVVYGEEQKKKAIETAQKSYGLKAIAITHEQCKDVFAIVLLRKQLTLDAFIKERNG